MAGKPQPANPEAEARSGRGLRSLLPPATALLLALSAPSLLLGLLYFVPSMAPAFTDAIPRVWRAVEACLTPAALFLLTNLAIGAVVLTSRFVQGAKRGHATAAMEEEEAEAGPKQSSGVQHKPPAPSPAKPASRLSRSKSEQIPVRPRKPDPAIQPKPVHKRVSSSAAVNGSLPDDDGSEEVDKKAEAFIGRFYQQMKLQRLESFLRYKDRIRRSQS